MGVAKKLSFSTIKAHLKTQVFGSCAFVFLFDKAHYFTVTFIENKQVPFGLFLTPFPHIQVPV